MRVPLQHSHLATLRDEQTAVTVALTNGVALSGLISSFDQFAITVQVNGIPQLVYKSIISHIQAASPGVRQKLPYVGRMNRSDRLPVQDTMTSMAPATKTPIIVRKKVRTVVLPTDRA